MKVLIIIDTLRVGGAEISLVKIAQRLKKVTPVFVHIYKEDTFKPELVQSGIKVYSLCISQNYGYIKAIKKLIPIYEFEKPDIIHSTLLRASVIAGILKFKYPHIPLIGSFVSNPYTFKNENLWMKFKLLTTYLQDRISAKKVDFFISNSQTIKRKKGDALLVDSEKIEVIYRGRNLKEFESIDLPEVQRFKDDYDLNDKNIILHVSRLVKGKGQEDLILAFSEVVNRIPDTILLIAGSGGQETSLKQEVERLSLSKNVIFLGKRKDIPLLLSSSEIFVFPSYAEGLPGALIEAMMSGKIIIASDIEENMECVDETNALIFRKGDVKELSGKICFAIKNKKNLKDLQSNATKMALEKFDIQNIADKYDNFYLKMVTK